MQRAHFVERQPHQQPGNHEPGTANAHRSGHPVSFESIESVHSTEEKQASGPPRPNVVLNREVEPVAHCDATLVAQKIELIDDNRSGKYERAYRAEACKITRGQDRKSTRLNSSH